MPRSFEKEPSTIQAKLGFQDTDLKTPQHDQIMIWLQQNIKEVCVALEGITLPPPGPRSWNPSAFDDSVKAYEVKKKELHQEWGPLEIPEVPEWLSVKTKWEQPIKSRDYTIGFIDMMAWGYYEPQLAYREGNYSERPWLRVDYVHRFTFNFEVKSHIPSLGELIRQIRFYQTYTSEREQTFIVVSPDMRWKDTLESQGIRFVAYPDHESENKP